MVFQKRRETHIGRKRVRNVKIKQEVNKGEEATKKPELLDLTAVHHTNKSFFL